MSTRKTPLSLLLAALAVAGCATTVTPVPGPDPGAVAPGPHDGLDAVLWLQTSPEYAAVTTSLYAAATEVAGRHAAQAPERVGGMAIVLDVDETVLDNVAYQAQLVLSDETYHPDSWDAWIARREAGAVPGVVDFLRASRALGLHIALITNRSCRGRGDPADPCPQAEDTRANLERLGIDAEGMTLYLRGDRPSEACRPLLTAEEQVSGVWSGDKTSRRACVALDREIVLLFGDQLGDFVDGEEGAAGPPGRVVAADYADHWGRSWFMLPNPTYGGWRPRETAEKRARISGID